MPIEITITGDNADEALKELRGLYSGLLARNGGERASSMPIVPKAPPKDLSDEDAEILLNALVPGGVITRAAPVQEEQPAKRRGRPRKVEAAPVAEAPAPAVQEEQDEEDAPADVPVDTPDVQAQDGADEARPVDAPLTTDDLRAAIKGYVSAFGMPAAMEDGPRVLALVMTGDLDAKQPDGSAYIASSIPADKLARAIKEFQMAVENNPFNRDRVQKGA